ncbi:MAG: adenylate kinase [Candidatus Krumholzibacteria bacterium]
MNLVILGAPGSGKGTQAVRLAERFNLRHISSGNLLRAEVASGTLLGKQVAGVMKKGKLVPDEAVLKVVSEVLTDEETTRLGGWILDGYPRTADQAEALEDVLSRNREAVEAVILLQVAADVLVPRLTNRDRADDTPETVRKRLEVYDREIEPLLDFYEQRYDVHRVDGSKPIEEVTEDIAGLVDVYDLS